MKSSALDFIDFQQVDNLLEGFNKTTGFVTAILDLDGNILSKSGWRRLCTHFHRINSDTVANCKISDTVLANRMGKGENYHFYKCLNGLVDVAVPIVIKGEHVANLFSGQFFFEKPDYEFFEKQADKYGFIKEDYLAALKEVPVVSKDKVKIAMEFLLNMTQLISEITYQRVEQSQLYYELNRTKEMARNTLDSMLEGCQIIGHDWKYLYLNKTAEIHNKIPNSELIGKRYMDVWPGIQETEVFKIIERVLVNKVSEHLENRFIFPDGSSGWFDLSIQAIPEGVFILSIDITERKQKEEQLYESEFRFSKLYENGPFGMVMADKEFRFKQANSAFCNILGYTEFELKQMTFKDISHPDDLLKDLPNIKKLMQREISVYKTEKRYIRKDGKTIWGSLTVTATYDRDGNFIYNLGIIEDITSRKNAEEQLMLLNERISTATRASQVGIWDWDIVKNIISWDDQMYLLYGLNKNDFEGAYEAWINGLHHGDREFSQNETELALQGKKEYDTEFRVIWPDSSIHYIKARGEVFRDKNGIPVRMVGINFDITEQKKKDQRIREKDQEFRKLSANVPGLIYQFTRRPDGTYFVPIASEGIINIFGCKPEDVLNDFEPIGKVIYHEDVERVIRDIEYSAENLTYFTCEFRVHIPGRDIQWIYSNSSPEKLPDGSITWYGFNTDITHIKKAEESLKISERRMDAILNGVTESLLLLDISGKVLATNYTAAKRLGTNSSDIIGNSVYKYINPKLLNKQKLQIKKMIISKEIVQFKEKNNDSLYHITLYPIIENTGEVYNFVVFTRDITEKQKAEDALIKSEEKFRTLIESIPLPVAYINEDGIILFRNNRFIQVFGYTEKDVRTIEHWWLKAYPDETYREKVIYNWKTYVDVAIKNGADIPAYEYDVTCSDGSIKTVLISGITINNNLLVTLIDISDRKKAEQEIISLNETLEQKVNARTSQLELANKELEAFSYSVSHDLRAPLRHINGYVDLLNKKYYEILPEKAQHYLTNIANATTQMDILIYDLLQFSRTGRQELNKVQINMNSLVHDVIEKFKIDQKNKSIIWETCDLPKVLGDFSLLKQVWINLIDNAVKYSRHSKPASIKIDCRVEAEDFIFRITDNGVGFDMKYAHKLFGVFQRLHLQSEFDGTGIGLALVQRIINNHGGKVWAEAELDKGAKFYFTIPKNQKSQL